MLSDFSVRVLLGGVVSIAFLLIIASSIHHRYHFTKRAFFTVLTGIVASVTIALVAVNIRLIQLSSEGSIDRRTAYMRVVACDRVIPIVPERGLFSQSSGNASYQVFEDGRLRYIGYRTDERADGSLGGFFRALGGSVTANSIALPLSRSMEESLSGGVNLQKFIRTNPKGDKYLELRSGETCDSSPSMVSLYTYEYSPTTHTYTQERILRSPEELQLTKNRFSEPDCIVVLFGEPSERTTENCNGYPSLDNISYSEVKE